MRACVRGGVRLYHDMEQSVYTMVTAPGSGDGAPWASIMGGHLRPSMPYAYTYAHARTRTCACTHARRCRSAVAPLRRHLLQHRLQIARLPVSVWM